MSVFLCDLVFHFFPRSFQLTLVYVSALTWRQQLSLLHISQQTLFEYSLEINLDVLVEPEALGGRLSLELAPIDGSHVPASDVDLLQDLRDRLGYSVNLLLIQALLHVALRLNFGRLHTGAVHDSLLRLLGLLVTLLTAERHFVVHAELLVRRVLVDAGLQGVVQVSLNHLVQFRRLHLGLHAVRPLRRTILHADLDRAVAILLVELALVVGLILTQLFDLVRRVVQRQLQNLDGRLRLLQLLGHVLEARVASNLALRMGLGRECARRAEDRRHLLELAGHVSQLRIHAIDRRLYRLLLTELGHLSILVLEGLS